MHPLKYVIEVSSRLYRRFIEVLFNTSVKYICIERLNIVTFKGKPGRSVHG